MKTHIECIACLVKQAVEIAQEHIPQQKQDTFIRTILERISKMDYSDPPPLMATQMYSLVRGLTGVIDPYAGVKKYYNEKALGLYPEFARLVGSSHDPLETALRIAVAGNIIDFGMGTRDSIQIKETVDRALSARFAINDIGSLRERLTDASTILYLADNAGEIVFDRLFIEQLGPKRVVCAVRHEPIINDATMDDAGQAGLCSVCRVISSGSPSPGTPLHLCSQEFRRLFVRADVVIAKGQGNFETLSRPGRDVFFLFMVKCPVISREAGVPVGSFVVMNRD